MANPFDKQELGLYGFDRLEGAQLTISEVAGESDNGWGVLDIISDATFSVLTDEFNSTNMTATPYPAGTKLFGAFNTTITISSGDVICYRRRPN